MKERNTKKLNYHTMGLAIVEIHDECIEERYTLQPKFHFLIDCQIDLHYYFSSYYSINHPIHWRAYFHVEESNIKVGSYLTKFTGLLKLSTSRKIYIYGFSRTYRQDSVTEIHIT